MQRRNVDKNEHTNTQAKQSKRRNTAQERKKQVESFIFRDESSRLLPGKKDTVGRKEKMQRRVLVKSSVDLHKEYSQTAELKHRMSYRQLLCYKTF